MRCGIEDVVQHRTIGVVEKEARPARLISSHPMDPDVLKCSVGNCPERATISAIGRFNIKRLGAGWIPLRVCETHGQLLDGKRIEVTLRDEDYGSPRFDLDHPDE